MHRVLERQLRRCGLDPDAVPGSEAAWRHLLDAVDRSYGDADEGRYVLERSMSVSSEEMAALHDRLHNERDKLHAVIQTIADGVSVVDADWNVLSLNPAGAAILRTPAELLVGSGLRELRALVDDDAAIHALVDDISQGRVRHGETMIGRGRAAVHVSWTASPVIQQDTLVGAVIVFRDVTETRRAETALHEREELLGATFAVAPVGLVRLDLAGNLQACNPAFLSMLELREEQLVGHALFDLVAESERDALVDAAASVVTGRTAGYEGEHRLFHRDGREVSANCSLVVGPDGSGQPAFLLGVFEDMTIRRHLELELANAQRLEAVGRLAAGIAHEINTPTQFVGDNLFFLQQAAHDLVGLVGDLDEAARRLAEAHPSAARELVELHGSIDVPWLASEIESAIAQARDGVSRVSTIVRAMKAFGHPDGDEKLLADLNEALTNTLVVARNEWKYIAEVETDLGDLPLVPCHLHDLNQVFLNLLVNAAHAIEDARHGDDDSLGVITVRTHVMDDGVVVAIGDTGTGIPEALRDRIFEPFFTTKEVGRGTGQGLALARAVVVGKHGGTLTFESETGVGTTFFVRLPLGRAEEAA